MRRALGTLFLLLLVSRVGHCQNFDFEKGRQPVLSLDGVWRFHTGDDPRWADPNIDDRDWPLLRSDRNWGEQGYKGYGGVAWYRFRVQAAADQPLALFLTKIADAYQVFANGQPVGALGIMPPRPASYGSRFALFPISLKSPSQVLNIAIRVWHNPGSADSAGGGPLQRGSLLGTPDILRSHYQASRIEEAWSHLNTLIFIVLEMIAGLAALSLYLIRRSEQEYGWYSLSMLFSAATRCVYVNFTITSSPENNAFLTEQFFLSLAVICWILFFAYAFEAPRTRFFQFALVTPVLAFIMEQLSLTIFPSLILQFVGVLSTELILYVWTTWATWQAMQKGLIEARLQFWSLLLDGVVALIATADYYLPALGLPVPKLLLLFGNEMEIGLFHFTSSNFTNLLVLFSALAILIARFTRTRHTEEQQARELEAARTVQQVLVPEETPAVPGFSIASVYKPAQEVGGDFFQVIPLTRGALVAIGDVSGKGLSAAMTVSLIVGTLRTLAEQTESPAAILQGLNRRLVGRSGFTTCLIAFLRPDGGGALASAGHLPPYRNGEEIETIADFPLGLSPDTLYEESPLTFQPNDRVTFLSDGVVEAKNAKGELFGFDRTRLNSTQPAEVIAKTAMQFGQEDDITVLTVEYRPLARILSI